MSNDREELEALRRMAELEAKSAGGSAAASVSSHYATPAHEGSSHPVTTKQRPVTAYDIQAHQQGGYDNFLAGVGGAIKGLIYTGPRSLIGVDAPGEVKDWKDSMNGLRDTFSGSLGNLVGTAAVGAPMAVIPGANTIPGSMVAGGTMGAMTPAENMRERTGNVAAGTLGGMAGQLGGRYLGDIARNRLANETADLAGQQARNATIDATRQAAVNEGYQIPPATINPSLWNRAKESLSGKIATQQLMARNNASVSDRLARQAAGLSPDEEITADSLNAARERLAGPYREVAALPDKQQVTARSGYTDWENPVQAQKPYDPAQALRDLQQARADAKLLWKKHAGPGGQSPESREAAKAMTDKAESLESGLEDYAIRNGKPELVQRLREARTALAKNFNVEDAMIEGGGSVDARVIGRMDQNGKPLTGELRTMGDFANNHPKLTQPDKLIGSPGVSRLDAVLSSLVAGGGGAALGPGGIALGAIPTASRWAMQRHLLSDTAQRAMVKPNYQPGAFTRLLGNTLPTPQANALMQILGPSVLLNSMQK